MDKYNWRKMKDGRDETCFISAVCIVQLWWPLNRATGLTFAAWEATYSYCTLLFSLSFNTYLFYSILFYSPPPVLDQLPFMMMSHPLIPASLAPASVSMAMGQMNRLSTLASMANVAHLHAKPPARAPTSVIKVNSEAHQPCGSDH